MYRNVVSQSASIFIALLALPLFVGCGGGPKVYPVTGVVKYEGGDIPTGELAEVHFYPATKSATAQMASGKIKPDGSFTLSTFTPDDGVQPGDYKVVFNVFKTYTGREPLTTPEFAELDKATTTATVKPGPNKFDFTIKKRT